MLLGSRICVCGTTHRSGPSYPKVSRNVPRVAESSPSVECVSRSLDDLDRAWWDACVARDHLGVSVPIPDGMHATRDDLEALADWLDTNGLAGCRDRWAADHAHPDHCPPWCVTGHDPVALIACEGDSRIHDGQPVEVGPVRVFAYRQVEASLGAVEESDWVHLAVDGHGAFMLPVGALDALREALSRVETPE